ncbi:Kiwa anti-phage protein KwaB-like domain-containing protein [Dyella sp. 2HG41-7]|uniref:Kiwa anti-phage protein KwaB-like domain-containing protein n=1 Tax=Dyella sp. 2HG41-7 TaxID=2883239 RepID=UPI001F33B11E|nr:Kiwa anti-phage protein KwaB-like domain-containing protein [Dyella sp. 2HG41-7]
MTQQAFDDLRGFDFDEADVHLWVFKRSMTAAKYVANYLRTDADLNAALKGFAIHEKERITEWAPYTYLAQTHENGCLSVEVDQTNFHLLKILVDRPEAEHAIGDVKKLRGVVGYVVKFSHNGRTVYATRRSPTTWTSAYRKKGVVNVFFKNGQLSAVKGDEFTLEPNFDLFCLDNSILIANKAGFEQVMQYRMGYVAAFGELQQQQQFVSLFTDLQPLIDHVGTNSTHLRRMAVIQEKCLYAQPGFMDAVQQVNTKRQWGIQFDAHNRIIPTANTASLIMKILLDQRLLSEITQIMYDVPEGIRVQ